QLLISAGKVNGQPQWFDACAPKQYPVQVVILPAGNGKGYTLEAAIPFASLGITPANGKQLLFDIAIDDSANGAQRLRQLMWNGGARNSSDRSQWGLAKFAQ
ncbi:MAG TPA: sugar-binding protein, partial [Armatimonadota bacterium]|nr:sugar-binding protein [Armatimonadota bacterium]